MKYQLVSGNAIDPAVVAAEGFRVAYELCNSVLREGDCLDELLNASDVAFERVMGTQATTVAGVVAKMKAAVTNHRGFNVPMEVLSNPLGDLERLAAEERTVG